MSVAILEPIKSESHPSGLTIQFFKKGRSRWYDFSVEELTTAHKVPSVTTILDVLGKQLTWWAQTTTLENVALMAKKARWEEEGLPIGFFNAEKMTEWLKAEKLTVAHKRDTAGDRGTAVHVVAEAYAKSGRIPDLSEFSPDVRGYVQALAAYLVKYQPTFKRTEVLVGSKTHNYAGTMDAWVEIDGEDWLLDFKTAKRVYPGSMFPQIAAYGEALKECGVADVPNQAIVRLAADGSYEVAVSDAVIEDFLAIKSAYHAFNRLEDTYKALQKEGA